MKRFPVFIFGTINIKIPILPKAIYTYRAIRIITAMTFFTELGKYNPKIQREPQKIANTILKTKLEVSHFMTSNFIT